MKRNVILFAIIICLTACTSAFYGCNTINLPISLGKYDNADLYLIGDQTYEGELTAIDIEWACGKVDVIPDDNATQISVKEESKNEIVDDQKVHTYFHDGVLMIKFWKSEYKGDIKGENKQLTVTYPATALSEMNVKLASGTCNIDSVEADKTKLDIASGSVSVNSVKGNTFELNLASGSINVTELKTEKLTTNLASGNFKVKTCDTNDFALSIMSGSVEIDFSTLSSATVNMTSGKTQIGIPSGGATLSLEKTSGSFKTELEYEKNGKDYVFGNGEAKITAHLVSGNIIITD